MLEGPPTPGPTSRPASGSSHLALPLPPWPASAEPLEQSRRPAGLPCHGPNWGHPSAGPPQNQEGAVASRPSRGGGAERPLGGGSGALPPSRPLCQDALTPSSRQKPSLKPSAPFLPCRRPSGLTHWLEGKPRHVVGPGVSSAAPPPPTPLWWSPKETDPKFRPVSKLRTWWLIVVCGGAAGGGETPQRSLSVCASPPPDPQVPGHLTSARLLPRSRVKTVPLLPSSPQGRRPPVRSRHPWGGHLAPTLCPGRLLSAALVFCLVKGEQAVAAAGEWGRPQSTSQWPRPASPGGHPWLRGAPTVEGFGNSTLHSKPAPSGSGGCAGSWVTGIWVLSPAQAATAPTAPAAVPGCPAEFVKGGGVHWAAEEYGDSWLEGWE